MYGYHSLIRAGWKSGVHDVRGIRYQHPWVVIWRPAGAAIGCWSKKEARRVLALLRQGIPAEAI
jgi:hypothetical protein